MTQNEPKSKHDTLGDLENSNEFRRFFDKLDNFCQIPTMFGEFMKIRKASYKWVINVPENEPLGVAALLQTDDLNSQKKNKTPWKPRAFYEKNKTKKRKNKKYILKK